MAASTDGWEAYRRLADQHGFGFTLLEQVDPTVAAMIPLGIQKDNGILAFGSSDGAGKGTLFLAVDHPQREDFAEELRFQMSRPVKVFLTPRQALVMAWERVARGGYGPPASRLPSGATQAIPPVARVATPAVPVPPEHLDEEQEEVLLLEPEILEPEFLEEEAAPGSAAFVAPIREGASHAVGARAEASQTLTREELVMELPSEWSAGVAVASPHPVAAPAPRLTSSTSSIGVAAARPAEARAVELPEEWSLPGETHPVASAAPSPSTAAEPSVPAEWAVDAAPVPMTDPALPEAWTFIPRAQDEGAVAAAPALPDAWAALDAVPGTSAHVAAAEALPSEWSASVPSSLAHAASPHALAVQMDPAAAIELPEAWGELIDLPMLATAGAAGAAPRGADAGPESRDEGHPVTSGETAAAELRTSDAAAANVDGPLTETLLEGLDGAAAPQGAAGREAISLDEPVDVPVSEAGGRAFARGVQDADVAMSPAVESMTSEESSDERSLQVTTAVVDSTITGLGGQADASSSLDAPNSEPHEADSTPGLDAPEGWDPAPASEASTRTSLTRADASIDAHASIAGVDAVSSVAPTREQELDAAVSGSREFEADGAERREPTRAEVRDVVVTSDPGLDLPMSDVASEVSSDEPFAADLALEGGVSDADSLASGFALEFNEPVAQDVDLALESAVSEAPAHEAAFVASASTELASSGPEAVTDVESSLDAEGLSLTDPDDLALGSGASEADALASGAALDFDQTLAQEADPALKSVVPEAPVREAAFGASASTALDSPGLEVVTDVESALDAADLALSTPDDLALDAGVSDADSLASGFALEFDEPVAQEVDFALESVVPEAPTYGAAFAESASTVHGSPGLALVTDAESAPDAAALALSAPDDLPVEAFAEEGQLDLEADAAKFSGAADSAMEGELDLAGAVDAFSGAADSADSSIGVASASPSTAMSPDVDPADAGAAGPGLSLAEIMALDDPSEPSPRTEAEARAIEPVDVVEERAGALDERPFDAVASASGSASRRDPVVEAFLSGSLGDEFSESLARLPPESLSSNAIEDAATPGAAEDEQSGSEWYEDWSALEPDGFNVDALAMRSTGLPEGFVETQVGNTNALSKDIEGSDAGPAAVELEARAEVELGALDDAWAVMVEPPAASPDDAPELDAVTTAALEPSTPSEVPASPAAEVDGGAVLEHHTLTFGMRAPSAGSEVDAAPAADPADPNLASPLLPTEEGEASMCTSLQVAQEPDEAPPPAPGTATVEDAHGSTASDDNARSAEPEEDFGSVSLALEAPALAMADAAPAMPNDEVERAPTHVLGGLLMDGEGGETVDTDWAKELLPDGPPPPPEELAGLSFTRGEALPGKASRGALALEFSDEDLQILESLEQIADGAEDVQGAHVRPARMVASLVRLLLRKGVISEREFLAELGRK